MADVSVIIPAYRAAGTIERALEGVVGQTVPPKEVVIVDDGSDDGTLAVAEAFAPRMGEIELKLFRQENAGAGEARNRAILESAGRYLAFLDADDEWLPEHLERSLWHIAEGGFTLTAHNEFLASGADRWPNDCAKHFKNSADPYVPLYCRGYISTATVVVEREAVFEVGGFDTGLRNGQDIDLWLAILARPENRFVVFDDALTVCHETQGSVQSHTGRRLRCVYQVARRWAPEVARRGNGGLRAIWERIAVIHYEAFSSYWRNGKPFAAIAASIPFPLNLLIASFVGLCSAPPDRPRYLSR